MASTIMNKKSKAKMRGCGLPAAAAIAGLTAIATLPGCNIVGPALMLVHGPEKTPAIFTLDPERATVVFIDDRDNNVPQRTMRDAMGRVAEDTLLQKKAVKDMIQSRLVQATIRQDRSAKLMTIAEVGRAVQADIVIYARIDRFTLSPDGQTYQPQAELRVKVVDATVDARIFPPLGSAEDSHRIKVTLRERLESLPNSRGEEVQARQRLAEAAGLAIAQIFYEHETSETPGKSLEDTRPK